MRERVRWGTILHNDRALRNPPCDDAGVNLGGPVRNGFCKETGASKSPIPAVLKGAVERA
jgi:hypothetical protein